MMAENDWNDPRNRFPAVLFRLSHRTKKKYRSGYREGDEDGEWPQPVVDSMRGWWEIAGADLQELQDEQALGVKYAVAFHQGRTLAVAQVDGWHWIAGLKRDDHHKKSVDEIIVDPSEGQESGPIEDERWRSLECSGRRLRWAFKASPAPDDVHRAWMGEDRNGTPIVGTRRDTIVSAWPYSLVDDERDLIERALRILGAELQGHVARSFGQVQTTTLIRDTYGDEVRSDRYLGTSLKTFSHDPGHWLRVVLSNWGIVRASLLPLTDDDFHQLRRFRNDWAHFAYRQEVTEDEIASLGRMTKLLDGIGAKSAATTVKFICKVLRVQVGRRQEAATS